MFASLRSIEQGKTQAMTKPKTTQTHDSMDKDTLKRGKKWQQAYSNRSHTGKLS
jgi:hypothetical protein